MELPRFMLHKNKRKAGTIFFVSNLLTKIKAQQIQMRDSMPKN